MTVNQNAPAPQKTSKKLPVIVATALALSLGVAGCSFSVENNTPKKEKAAVSKEDSTAIEDDTDSSETVDSDDPDAVLESTLKDIHDLAYELGEELPEANGSSYVIAYGGNNTLTLSLDYSENVSEEENSYVMETVRSAERDYTFPDGIEFDIELELDALEEDPIGDDLIVVKGWYSESDTYDTEENPMTYPNEEN